jgi:phosphoserine aminotransferase
MTRTAPSPAPTAARTGDRILNFSPGPAVLPEKVIRQAQADLWNIFGSGIGIMEHSHRGKVFDRVIDEAVADCRTMAGIGDDHAILFLQGGATLQFGMIPLSFLPPGRTADYVDTGVWANKALKEAKKIGTVNVAYDGSRSAYDHVPAAAEIKTTSGAAYLHYCSNNTIFGTQFAAPPAPAAGVPLVADMSSDIFSRPVDVGRHALIYAGAQKNLGPAGVTLVIIRRDFMAGARDSTLTMLDYRKHAEQDSRLNTPPTFGIYVMGQVFKWILEQGGLDAVGRRNREKAKIVYDAIDSSGGFYRAVARPDSRSQMNVTFRCPTEELDKSFAAAAEKSGMSGLKGHRDVGGLRASIYNAFPVEGCRTLASFMADFARTKG